MNRGPLLPQRAVDPEPSSHDEQNPEAAGGSSAGAAGLAPGYQAYYGLSSESPPVPAPADRLPPGYRAYYGLGGPRSPPVQGRAKELSLQRKAADGAPAAAPAAADSARIVPDGTPDLRAGQMTRSAFLQAMRQAVIATASEAFGPLWSALACPSIERWFARNANADPAELERLVRRLSGLQGPGSASEYIAPMCARLRAGIERQRQGQDVSADLAAAGLSGDPAAADLPKQAAAPAPAAGPALQAKRDGDAAPAAPGSPAQIAAALGPGAPLDGGTAARMEGAFGESFADVRVHTDATAGHTAAQVRALAFTVGSQVAFAPGQYQPGTPTGDALLAHELAHVVQQRGAAPGVAPMTDGPGESAHEREADEAAAGVLGRLYGGARTALSGVADRVRLAMSSGINLQRCSPEQAEQNKQAGDQAAKDAGAPAPPVQDAGPAATDKDAGPGPAAPLAPQTTFKTSTYKLSTDEIPVVKGNDKAHQAEIKESPAVYCDRILRKAGLDPATWFSSFTSIKFLGRNVADIHTDLATHLKAVESKLAQKYGGAAQDPATAGVTLGLKEDIGGARHAPTSATLSMHLFGLAIDVNYTTNPFISDSANDTLGRAGLLVSGTKGAFTNGMTYDQLSALDQTLETYFSYLDEAKKDALDERLKAATAAPWKGLDADAAKKQIQRDLDSVAGKWERGSQKDVIKKSGFLDLRKELVEGLDLSWGASYGDMMHFDLRNKGNGAKIQAAIGSYKAEKDAESKKKWTDDHPDPK